MTQKRNDLCVGAFVKTLKGCRFGGPFTGVVVGFTKNANGQTVRVRKTSNGKDRVVCCRPENLVVLIEANLLVWR